MNLFEALGESVTTEFAARRDTVPRTLHYGHDAPERLAEDLLEETPGRRVVVLSDVRTREIGGPSCVEALRAAGWKVVEHLVPDGLRGESPVCDDITYQKLAETVAQADGLVAVGSGVINDLTKWLAAARGIPYAVFATAASMNGYSAANVAPSLRGVKTLQHAHAPRIIAADPAIIESAPFFLTAAGLGDLIAKPVSTADWVMNHRLFGEEFSPSLASILDPMESQYAGKPEAIAGRETSTIKTLFEALIYSGCAMTLHGSSLPASGGEHLISHTLDMMSHRDGVPHDLHGRQVGVGTIVVAALYQRMIAIDKPVFRLNMAEVDPQLWGPLTPVVEEQHQRKRDVVTQACATLSIPGAWQRLRDDLAPMLREPAEIKVCLSKAQAAHRASDIGCTQQRLLTAIRACGAIRARFTSIDLAWLLGVLPGSAGDIIDEWLC